MAGATDTKHTPDDVPQSKYLERPNGHFFRNIFALLRRSVAGCARSVTDRREAAFTP